MTSAARGFLREALFASAASRTKRKRSSSRAKNMTDRLSRVSKLALRTVVAESSLEAATPFLEFLFLGRYAVETLQS